MGAVVITNDVFDRDIGSGSGPAVIDFGATWCGPCQALAPEIEKMATEYDGRVLIGKVDVDESTDLATRFSVMSVPTILFFKNGEKVDQISGNFPDKIRERIETLIAQ
ncbi:MAG: thioredoxin [Planctomycetes bacterium]|nr:thioredoxin [Planctomycetota bacterium]